MLKPFASMGEIVGCPSFFIYFYSDPFHPLSGSVRDENPLNLLTRSTWMLLKIHIFPHTADPLRLYRFCSLSSSVSSTFSVFKGFCLLK